MQRLATMTFLALVLLGVAGCTSSYLGADPRSDATLFDALNRGAGADVIATFEARANLLAERGQRTQAAWALSRAVSVANRTGEFQTSIRLGTRGLEILEATPPDMVRPLLHYLLGFAYSYVGDRSEAKRLWEKGWSLVESNVEPRPRKLYLAMFVRALGHVEGWQLNRVQELALYQAALELLATYRECDLASNEGCVVVRRETTSTLLSLTPHQPPEKAEQSLKRALFLVRQDHDRDSESRVLQALGAVALRANNPIRAEEKFRDALAVLPSTAHSTRLISIRAGLGAALLSQGRHESALATLTAAIDQLESVRGQLETAQLRRGFFGLKQSIYRDAIQAALGTGQPSTAFELAERARARAFLDALGTRTMLSRMRQGTAPEDEAAVRSSVPSSASASTQAPDQEMPGNPPAPRVRSGAVIGYERLLEQTRRSDPEQASLLTVQPVRAAEIQDSLDADTTLVAYFVMPQETVAWVVSRSRLDAVRIQVRRSALQLLVEDLRRSIEGGSRSSAVESELEHLHHLLLEPVLAHVSTAYLLLVPHDVLHYLPFGALRSRTGKWVVDEYTLSTLPSASVLKYIKTKGMGAFGKALAIGSPASPGSPPLPFAEREARLIADRFPGAVLLLGQQATKQAVLRTAADASLIHFASHAELNEKDPMSSAILLTPEGDEPGRLEAREILRLDLATKLVVLAACETGLGELQTGDELLGLQRAFLYAGAASILSTLWKVDDRATYHLMRLFYEAWPKVGPAAALREAQRQARRLHPHPFSWAAFVVTGLPR